MGKNKIKIQSNIPLSPVGRKDCPPNDGWFRQYEIFPVLRMKIGQSFNTGIEYDYGKTICIKNACRRISDGKMKFAVRKWRNYIRVWRTK